MARIDIVILSLLAFASLVFGHTLGAKDSERRKPMPDLSKVSPMKWETQNKKSGEDEMPESLKSSERALNDLFVDRENMNAKEKRLDLANALRQAIHAHQLCANAEIELARFLCDNAL